eukprot:7550301-Karenia_brevis.AAC.1
MGCWVKAVQEGKTVPMSSEALQMLKDIQDKCTREQFVALKASLDWVPLVLGDGKALGSMIQKYSCAVRMSMPITDGQ